MTQQHDKISENKTAVTAAYNGGGTTAVQLKNNRKYSVVQRKLAERSAATQQASFTPVQRKANNTGLPNNLKSGIENLSGHSMDDVKVHYNSDKPAQLNAHAYAQGSDIHIASGQEKHLPHEAWHVVQQKQGRVKPNLQMKGKVNVNDDSGLEKEADVMGNKALNIQLKKTGIQIIESNVSIPQVKQLSKISKLPPVSGILLPCGHESQGIVQRMILFNLPPEAKDIEELEKYVYGTVINNRGQNFEEAISGHKDAHLWMDIIRDALYKKEIVRATQQIKNVIDIVNDSETKKPHHPNPVHKGKNGGAKKLALENEAPYTISKTALSTSLVNKARKLIIDSRQLDTNKFMLGLLVLPDGQQIFALSGNKPEMVKLVEMILEKDFQLFNNKVYDKTSISPEDEAKYEEDVSDEIGKNDKYFAYEDRKVVRKRSVNKEDLGSFPANCSAAVALSVAKTVDPKAFTGSAKMGLTEVFVSGNPNSKVLIYNKLTAEGDSFTMHDEDVPSCHVCQMQLAKVASEVVELERQGITERVRMEIDKTSYSIEQSTKKLTALKQEKEQKSPLASQEKVLEKAFAEGKEKQLSLKQDLTNVEQKLKNTTKKLNKFNAEVEGLEEQINNLNYEKKGWDKEAKTSKKFELQMLAIESRIKKLEDKITELEADYKELHNAGKGFGIVYTAWHKKIAALQVKYPEVKPKDMESKLSKEIEALEKIKSKEEADKSRVYGENTSASFTARVSIADQKKRDISDEIKLKTGSRNEMSAHAKELSIDQIALKEENDKLNQEIEKLILENKNLEVNLSESSTAAQELRKIDKEIKDLETTQAREIRELKILTLKQNVYH
ncbi:uncharacterized protein DUF4157 [Flavobacterium sp. 9]|uniref:eCIS core domain-containing protein n=1 Tax=Flavobacterium sp. 9 TaxID=2035198 RepID=UPI000C1A6865|nr:DUF4157 domain-containing protein [Flavobacterium sp. 9]PIF29809.1 uncharacterized protein DUF4157 [Flavobacterium sp. 9]